MTNAEAYKWLYVHFAPCGDETQQDAAVTKAAMGNFLSDIRGGEQVVDAFAAFCQTVLQVG